MHTRIICLSWCVQVAAYSLIRKKGQYATLSKLVYCSYMNRSLNYVNGNQCRLPCLHVINFFF